MTDSSAPESGATDETRTDSEPQAPNDEPRPAADERIEQLESENHQLQERIDDLEGALAEFREELADVQNGPAEGGTETPGKMPAGTPELVTSGGQPTKIIGKIDDDDGIGVLGEATGDGATAGVQGEADSIDGYGLYTPDDAKVDGEIETTELNSNGNDFTLQTGYTADDEPASIVMGHQANDATFATGGGVVLGGGSSGSDDMNVVTGGYPTIVGGLGNQILTTEENYDTILGGRNNVMGDDGDFDPLYSTISGGRDNEIEDANYAFVAGRNAVAKHDGAVVFGDSSDTEVTSARADEARFQGDLATNSELRTNADASNNLSYLRFRDETGSDGPRLFHSETGGYIAARGEEEFDVDMDLQVNRDGTKQRTAGPIAKASIAADATIQNAVNIESVTYHDDAVGWYEVDVTDFAFNDQEHVAVVMPRDFNEFPGVYTSGTNEDTLWVEFEDGQAAFHLLVYDLPSGTVTTSAETETTTDDEQPGGE